MSRARQPVGLALLGVIAALAVYALFSVANSTGALASWFIALAGWAQAWGGLMAIAAAYAIASGQAAREERRRQEVRRSSLKTLVAAVEYGFDLLTAAKDRLGHAPVNLTAFNEHFAPGKFAAVIETLERAPLYDLGMYEVSVEVIRFRLLLAEARDRLLATVEGMTAVDRRTCSELIGLHVQAVNLKSTLLHRAAHPGLVSPGPVQPGPNAVTGTSFVDGGLAGRR